VEVAGSTWGSTGRTEGGISVNTKWTLDATVLCCEGGIRSRGVCRLSHSPRRNGQHSRRTRSNSAPHGSNVRPRRLAGNAHTGLCCSHTHTSIHTLFQQHFSRLTWISRLPPVIFILRFYAIFLQCFDTVGWATGRASRL